MTDNIGNVRAVINSQRESDEVRLESFADYYSFGLPMPGQHANNQEYELDYQGQRKDAETGFNAFELRMFDARIGRWMAPDPYEQHWSPYLAMSNNPITRIDPDGGNDVPQAKADSDDEKNLQRAHDMRVASLAKFHGDVNSEIYSDLSPRDREDIITMNPHMRDQLQNYYGSTAAAQDINRIFTLASLGGYKDKDGKTLHALNGQLGYYVKGEGKFKNVRPTLKTIDGFTALTNEPMEIVQKFIPIFGGGGVYDWGRIGDALGAAGTAFDGLENAIANKYWWMDSQGNYNSTKVLEKGANGKYVKGVQGYRNGYNSALNIANKFKVAGNITGGLGLLVTGAQLYNNQITATEAFIDAAFGVIGFLGPIGAGVSATYFIGKLGYEYFSGNTLFEKPR